MLFYICIDRSNISLICYCYCIDRSNISLIYYCNCIDRSNIVNLLLLLYRSNTSLICYFYCIENSNLSLICYCVERSSILKLQSCITKSIMFCRHSAAFCWLLVVAKQTLSVSRCLPLLFAALLHIQLSSGKLSSSIWMSIRLLASSRFAREF